MNRLTAALAVATLAGCGPAWQGKVSGYTLDQKDALFTVTTDSKGASSGLVIVLSDQAGMCAQLAAKSAPPNMAMAAFVAIRTVDNKALSPDKGDYIIVSSSSSVANGSSAFGFFMKTDSNGTNSIPATSRQTSSGMLKVSQLSYEQGTLTGSFDGKFGGQNDPVSTVFTASRCTISTDQLVNGFLAAGGAGSSSSPTFRTTQSAACSQYLSCYSATGGDTSSLSSTYGYAGTCWTTTQAAADACNSACESALTSYRNSAGSPSVCY